MIDKNSAKGALLLGKWEWECAADLLSGQKYLIIVTIDWSNRIADLDKLFNNCSAAIKLERDKQTFHENKNEDDYIVV